MVDWWDGSHVGWGREEASWLQKAFQDPNSRVKEGTHISWFTGFGNRDYNCGFPIGGNIAVVDRKVVKVGEVLKSYGAKIFEVMNVEVNWTSGKRIATVFNSLRNSIRREGGYQTI